MAPIPSTPGPTWALALAGVALAMLVVWHRRSAAKHAPFPVVNKSYGGRRQQYISWLGGAMFNDAYRLFKNDIYRIPTPEGDHVIIPRRYMDELKDRPDDELDFVAAFMKVFENGYTDMHPGDANVTILGSVVREELTRNLGAVNAILAQAVAGAVAAEFSSVGDQWKPMAVHPTLRRVVAMASGEALAGPELGRNKDHIRISVDFTVDLMLALYSVLAWPGPLRPVAAWFAAPVARVRGHKRAMQDMLAPLLEQRRAARARGEQPKADVLQWMLDRCDRIGSGTPENFAKMMLLLIFAAAHTITLAITLILYDLADRPQVLEQCRAEIRQVLQDHDGVLNTKTLYSMKFVDSVMRESQRMNPPSIEAFRRVAVRDITLKDGTVIPAGSMIESANEAVLRDPELYPNPDKFDAARFLRLRTDPGERDPIGYKNREMYQYTGLSKENINFGYGKHSCPGRFFAAHQIKMLLVQLLLNYDIAAPEGGDGETSQTKTAAHGFGPDLTRELLFRRRG